MNTRQTSMQRAIGGLFLFCVVLMLSVGCAGKSAIQETFTAAPAVERVVLRPGDEIEIKFAYAEQFNEIQMVRPDGKIELQFVGEIMADGKTPGELREELKAEFAKHLKHPQLAVMVRTLNEQRVYVGGEVNLPGMLPMPHRMTALEAIMQAGGFNLETAKTKTVIVMRTSLEGTSEGFVVNLKPALKGERIESFYLEPRDIVFVPQTTIKKYNQWVEQYINGIVPDVGLTFGRSYGKTSYGYDTGGRRR
jgi:polysaccharide biosynthesis/export protein